MRKYVQEYLVREFGALAACHFCFKLLNAFLAGAGDALVGAYNNSLDAVGLMKRRQGQDHLDGGAVGVGDYVIRGLKYIGINLRHHQRHGRVHTPVGGVVHHVAANLRKTRRQLGRYSPSGRENGKGGLSGNGFIGTHNRPLLALEKHFLAPGTLRGNRQQLRHRELAFLKDLQHL